MTRGAVVSTEILNELDALYTSLAFLKDPASTDICADPAKPELGEKVAVYESPEPAKLLMVPPLAATSSTPKSLLA